MNLIHVNKVLPEARGIRSLVSDMTSVHFPAHSSLALTSNQCSSLGYNTVTTLNSNFGSSSHPPPPTGL
jgi:hypothetical protein